MRNNRDENGITFYKLSDGITANEKVIADYRKRAKELEEKLEGKNEQLTAAYMEEVQVTAWTLVWLTLLMEILFEACIAYVWYYYYRSYVERSETVGIIEASPLEEKSDFSKREKELRLLERIQALESEIMTLRATNTSKRTQDKEGIKINGIEPLNGFYGKRMPIGFFSDRQHQQPTMIENTSGQTWTGVDRGNLRSIGRVSLRLNIRM